MKINFGYFQIQRWMLLTVRAEKVDEKNGVTYLVSMFPSWIMVLEWCKKCNFCNFALTSARNLSLLNKFTNMHLKVLITLFQKMIWFMGVWATYWFMGVWATVHEILTIKTSKEILIQQKFIKILRFQTQISPKQ